jgi:hypothetical protein
LGEGGKQNCHTIWWGGDFGKLQSKVKFKIGQCVNNFGEHIVGVVEHKHITNDIVGL